MKRSLWYFFFFLASSSQTESLSSELFKLTQIYFFKGNKNTSACISAPCCSFLPDICFWPLSDSMYWNKWTSTLTHNSFSTVLTEIPAAQSALKNSPKKKFFLDSFYCYCTDTTKHCINFLGRRVNLDLFWRKWHEF